MHPVPYRSALTRGITALALCAAALQAQAQTASAQATLSNVRIEVIDQTPGDNIYPWVAVFNDVTWLSQATSLTTEAGSPAATGSWTGWLGAAQAAQASVTGAQASATLTAGDWSPTGNIGGSASASASDSLSAWAVTQIFNGRFVAGAQTRLVLTADVAVSATANGGSAQSTALISMADLGGGGIDQSEAFVFDDPNLGSSQTPATLSVTWNNTVNDPNNGTWGELLVTASASVTAAAVPEPGAAALLALGLAGLGLRTRGARRHNT